MFITTRYLALAALIMGAAALALSFVTFSGVSLRQHAPAVRVARGAFQNALHTAEAASAEAARAYYINPPAYDHYVHPLTGLSFAYPRDFTLEVVEDTGGEIVLATNPQYGMGFQIFIQPFDEPGPLTLTRIRRDLPDLVMEEVVETELLADATPVIRFTSRDPVLGELREAWFIREGFLYQITFHVPDTEVMDAWFLGFLQDLNFAPPEAG